MTALLECRDLHAGYGGTTVVRSLDLSICAGEVVALLGPNGAGKTTTLLTLAGLLPRLGGRVALDGVEVSKPSGSSLARQGVVLVPDDRALFTGLTAKENLVLALPRGGSIGDVLDCFPALRVRLGVAAGLLSGGEQQMLAMARAFVRKPKVLLVDELSLGLAPVVVKNLLAIVRSIASDTGVAVVLVEQHVHLVLRSADRAVVLAHGREVLARPAASLLAEPGLLERAYLGALDEHETGSVDRP